MFVKRRIVLFFLLLAGTCFGQQQELTVKIIYGGVGGSLTGRAPDTIKWSPDGTKVSYIVHDQQGENAQLYYIDLMLCPRKAHSISGPAARIHLFTRIHNNFRRELLSEQPMEPGRAE